MSWIPRAQLASLSILLACIVLRMVVGYDPFPGWADDPTRLPVVLTTIGPAHSALIDGVMILAAAAVVMASNVRRSARDHGILTLASVGIVAAIVTARLRAGDVDTLVIALNWVAAMFGAVAIGVAAREEPNRRLAAAVLLGTMGLLVTRAGVQFLIENPQAYEDFKRSKMEILAAHGWSVDSPLAKSFERRVSQPDAGGWFGLSNVLGSVAAGGSVAFLALILRSWKVMRDAKASIRDVGLWALGLGFAVAVVTLLFTMSKGAMVAACAGTGLLMLAKFRPRPMRAMTLGLACIAGPIALVVARGLVGERLGELSLLFRWFYLEGAAEIVSGPGGWRGVGPAGFQDAYMRAKPAISPENVSSPHSVLIDFVAALGVFGMAWVAIIAAWAARGGRNLAPSPASAPLEDASGVPAVSIRSELRLVVGIAAIPTLLAALIEREMATEWSTIVRLAGLFLFSAAASGVLIALRRDSGRIALAVGALAVLLHAQIDMVGTNQGSAPWFFALLALAATPVGRSAEEPSNVATPRGVRWCSTLPVVLVLASLAWCVPAIRDVWLWQARAGGAAVLVRPIPLSHMIATSTLGNEGERLREAAQMLSTALGRGIEAVPSSVEAAMREARITLVDRAIPMMLAACDAMPSHMGTHRAASELLLMQGLVKRSIGDAAAGDGLTRQAQALMEAFVARQPGKATAWAWLGLLNRTMADQWQDPGAIARAIVAYARAAEIDPHGVVNIPPLVDLLVAAGDAQQAKRWAAAGLARNADLRLDRLSQLPVDQEARLRAVAGGR